MSTPTAAPTTDSAIERVQRFLKTMEARLLDDARRMLSPDFVMCFPGSARFTRLEELIEYGSRRYQGVSKRFERFDVSRQGDTDIVYCFGVLVGRWPDGRTFDDIRFIDRFEMRDGLLTRQDVWNDIAERRPADLPQPTA